MDVDIPSVMKAVIIADKGPPSSNTLKCIDKKVPDIGEDELLVRIIAAGVNVVDCKLRSGKIPSAKVQGTGSPFHHALESSHVHRRMAPQSLFCIIFFVC